MKQQMGVKRHPDRIMGNADRASSATYALAGRSRRRLFFARIACCGKKFSRINNTE
jgi:hypothetical protein